jgi:hypothetical protein
LRVFVDNRRGDATGESIREDFRSLERESGVDTSHSPSRRVNLVFRISATLGRFKSSQRPILSPVS